jgi:hypothetical protein
MNEQIVKGGDSLLGASGVEGAAEVDAGSLQGGEQRG